MINGRSGSRFYHPELDCLRFVAFLSVFVYHLAQEFATLVPLNSPIQWLIVCCTKSGVFGVDLFFCLSSFLITTLLLREYDLRGTVDVRAFWMRRILRIWPLYYLFLLLSATLFPYLLGVLQTQLCGWRLLHYWYFLGNWDCIVNGWHLSPVGPLWSISMEEQFYFAWPLLLLIVKPKRIFFLGAGMVVGANILRLLYPPASFAGQWTSPFYHLDPIAWGIIGAHFVHQNRWQPSLPLRLVLFLTGVTLIPGYFFFHGFDEFFAGKDLAPLPIGALCCIFVVMSVFNLEAVPWGSVVMKGWVYLGRISYGLYVFHMLCIFWFLIEIVAHGYYDGGPVKIFSPIVPVAFGIVLCLTTLLAWLSYRFLEKPFLKLKEKYAYVPSAPQGTESKTLS